MYKGDVITAFACCIGMVFAAKSIFASRKGHKIEGFFYLFVCLTFVVFVMSSLNHDPKIGTREGFKPSKYPECQMYTTVEQRDNCEAMVVQQDLNDLTTPNPSTTVFG